MPENDGPTTRFRRKLSFSHLSSAHRFACECSAIEEQGHDSPTRSVLEEVKGLAMAAVISSVAFLEAAINETFDDAKGTLLHGVPDEVCALLAETWKLQSIDHLGVLAKYQLSLLIARKPRFAPGHSPYQDAHALIYLRDKLVHARATWERIPSPQDQGEMKKIEQQLRSRFEQNAILKGSVLPYFPDKCLGAGCANWAAHSSRKFFVEYCSQMGISSPDSRFHDTWEFRGPWEESPPAKKA